MHRQFAFQFFPQRRKQIHERKESSFFRNWNSFPFSNLWSSYAGDPVLAWLWYFQTRSALQQPFSEQTSAYYNVCSEAADFYSELVQTLEGFQEQAKTETAYYQLVSDYLNSQENVEWNSEEHTAEYVRAFSDTQSLAVKIAVFWTDCTADSTASDNAASDNAVSDTINAGLDVTSSNIAGILSWNTVVTADWNPDNSQSVYKGE